MKTRIFRFAIPLVVAGFVHLASLSGVARAASVSEYDLKTAYIYNFAVFTEWSLGQLIEGMALGVCVHDDNPMHDALNQLTGREVKGRQLVVKSWEGLQIPHGCHILLLERGDQEQWNAMRESASDSGMLTIADSEADLAGVVITLVLEDGRLKFRIDTAAARRADLVLSAKLLRLADTIQ